MEFRIIANKNINMEERTEISALGEFGLIDHLTNNNEIKNASTILSIGDDEIGRAHV